MSIKLSTAYDSQSGNKSSSSKGLILTAPAALVLLWLASAFMANASPERSCSSALSEQKKDQLIAYVIKKYKIPSSVSVTLKAQEPVSESCYRKLTFEGKSTVNTWRLNLYLSDDERFLSSEILDITIDPALEEARKNAALVAGLVPVDNASLGPEDAPVTIVEFSDFECPYCQKLAAQVDQLDPSIKGQVRLIFHHMPLSIHPWARQAAEAAACAQLQSSEAFWAMHDAFFQHQNETTVENITEQTLKFARATNSLDLRSFQTCLDKQMSLGLVLKDINLANANNVNATPTLFINGRRTSGFPDGVQLRDAILNARKDANTQQPTAQKAQIAPGIHDEPNARTATPMKSE